MNNRIWHNVGQTLCCQLSGHTVFTLSFSIRNSLEDYLYTAFYWQWISNSVSLCIQLFSDSSETKLFTLIDV